MSMWTIIALAVAAIALGFALYSVFRSPDVD